MHKRQLLVPIQKIPASLHSAHVYCYVLYLLYIFGFLATELAGTGGLFVVGGELNTDHHRVREP